MLLLTAGQSISTVFVAYALQAAFGQSARAVAITMPLTWVLSAIPVGLLNDGRLRRWLLRLRPGYQVPGALFVAHGLTGGGLAHVVIGQVNVGLGFGTIWGPVHDRILAAACEPDPLAIRVLWGATVVFACIAWAVIQSVDRGSASVHGPLPGTPGG